MNNIMKHIKLLALLCVLGMVFASCEKNQKSEWSNFYGYTNSDIIGDYGFSNASDAFDGVEGAGRYACPDAEISIAAYTTNTVEFKINCPSKVFSRAFTGKPMHLADDVMLQLSSGYKPAGEGKLKAYNVSGHVLKNDKQQIRIQGFASVNTYIITFTPEGIPNDTVADDGTYYYFDVIKN